MMTGDVIALYVTFVYFTEQKLSKMVFINIILKVLIFHDRKSRALEKICCKSLLVSLHD